MIDLHREPRQVVVRGTDMSGPRFPEAAGRYIPAPLRAMIMERSEGICFYCGNVAQSIDHIIPWSQGGSHHPLNLVAACTPCNSIAGERLFRDITDKMEYIDERRQLLYAMGIDVSRFGMERGSTTDPTGFATGATATAEPL